MSHRSGIHHLLLYPFIQDHSSYELFAHYIMKEKYENFDYSYLNGRLPNSEAEFSTKKTGLDYLYIPHGYEYDNFEDYQESYGHPLLQSIHLGTSW